MRGIYIIEKSGDKVTGHYLSKRNGRWRVHRFKNCSLEAVIEEAELVIHEPTVYTLTKRGNQ
tara:strand:+ start:572 stop:757 length:186 start_codon:yes stop_codon:yes gene_type:complete